MGEPTTVRSCDHTECRRAATTLVLFVGMYGSYCDEHTDLVESAFQVVRARPLTTAEKARPLLRHQDAA
jgi:hypothetical protein